ncbi:MAG TPA: hypothetical protein VF570_16595 [Pyrinomonadaceae bacterium]
MTVSAMLRAHLPAPPAFGLPAFVFLLGLLRLMPSKVGGKTTPLRQWPLAAAALAAVRAWPGPRGVKRPSGTRTPPRSAPRIQYFLLHTAIAA